MGPITPDERAAVMARSPVKGKYDVSIDADSAYEALQKRVESAAPGESVPQNGDAETGGGLMGGLGQILGGIFGTTRKRGERLNPGQTIAREVTRTVTNRIAGQIAADIGKSLGGKMGGSVGRAIVRGALGGILRR